MPVHIVFLELIIDPACSLVFEAEGEEADVMRRPPRHPGGAALFADVVMHRASSGGRGARDRLAVFAMRPGPRPGGRDSRTLAFTTLIVSNLALILTNRSGPARSSSRSSRGIPPWPGCSQVRSFFSR